MIAEAVFNFLAFFIQVKYTAAAGSYLTRGGFYIERNFHDLLSKEKDLRTVYKEKYNTVIAAQMNGLMAVCFS